MMSVNVSLSILRGIERDLGVETSSAIDNLVYSKGYDEIREAVGVIKGLHEAKKIVNNNILNAAYMALGAKPMKREEDK